MSQNPKDINMFVDVNKRHHYTQGVDDIETLRNSIMSSLDNMEIIIDRMIRMLKDRTYIKPIGQR